MVKIYENAPNGTVAAPTSTQQPMITGKSYLLNQPIQDSVSFGNTGEKKKNNFWKWALGIGIVAVGTVLAVKTHKSVKARLSGAKTPEAKLPEAKPEATSEVLSGISHDTAHTEISPSASSSSSVPEPAPAPVLAATSITDEPKKPLIDLEAEVHKIHLQRIKEDEANAIDLDIITKSQHDSRQKVFNKLFHVKKPSIKERILSMVAKNKSGTPISSKAPEVANVTPKLKLRNIDKRTSAMKNRVAEKMLENECRPYLRATKVQDANDLITYAESIKHKRRSSEHKKQQEAFNKIFRAKKPVHKHPVKSWGKKAIKSIREFLGIKPPFKYSIHGPKTIANAKAHSDRVADFYSKIEPHV